MDLLNNMVAVEDDVLFCAFRYALGRRTYVVGKICEAIRLNASSIQSNLRSQMIREISEAVDTKQAGDDIDVQRWLECRRVLQQSLMHEERGRDAR